MPITYKIDVLAALKAAGYNTNRIRKEKLLSESTLQRLRKGELINGENLGKLCELLRCQPGDILEYVPEELPSRAAEAPPAPELSEYISVLDLSVRTFNIVCRAGVRTVAELEAWVHSDKCCLEPERSPGYKEILEALEAYKEKG